VARRDGSRAVQDLELQLTAAKEGGAALTAALDATNKEFEGRTRELESQLEAARDQGAATAAELEAEKQARESQARQWQADLEDVRAELRQVRGALVRRSRQLLCGSVVAVA